MANSLVIPPVLPEPIPAYAWKAIGALMRIDDKILKTTVFVGVESGGKFVPLGTGFFAAIVYRDAVCTYLVTAQHVFDAVAGDYVSVRLNRKGGDSETVRVSKLNAWPHERPENDIVAIPMGISPDVYDQFIVDVSRSELDSARVLMQPSLGDEVVAVGLYTSHYGRVRNAPVVRVGHIAAMPDEPVKTSAGYVASYLVEIRSIAGLSGSPVYLNPPDVRVHKGKMQHRTESMHVPVGVLVGYHVVESKEDQIAVPQFQGDDARASSALSQDERNTGFTVVIPIERVTEVLEREPVKSMREDVVDDHLKKGYRPASAKKSAPAAALQEHPATEGDDQHRERFTALLDAVVQKPKRDD
jgi:hypothetical protein